MPPQMQQSKSAGCGSDGVSFEVGVTTIGGDFSLDGSIDASFVACQKASDTLRSWMGWMPPAGRSRVGLSNAC